MSKLTMEFARRDDCLDRMVTSDLRVLIGERDALAADNKRLREAAKVAQSALRHMLHNIQACGKRVDLGLATDSAEGAVRVINAALAGSKDGDL